MVPSAADIYKHLFETLEITRYDTDFIARYPNAKDPLREYVIDILKVLKIPTYMMHLTIGHREVALYVQGPSAIEDRIVVGVLPANAQAFIRFWDSNANI